MLRGYNRSGQPEGIANYALEHLVGDVRGLVQVSKEALIHPEVKLDQLSFQGLGVERCSVVAHDWGGPIAWTFAALYPEMVRDLRTSNTKLSLETKTRIRWSDWCLGGQPDHLQLPSPDRHENQPARKLEADLKSWYMVFFQVCALFSLFFCFQSSSAQCPVLPELLAMSEDSAQLNSLLKDARLPDHQEVSS